MELVHNISSGSKHFSGQSSLETVRLLNEVLATHMVCIMRFRHQQIIAKGQALSELSAKFAKHAEAEQVSMLILAERIFQLGGDPDFNPETVIGRTLSEYQPQMGDDLVGMIQDDLVAVRVLCDIYKKLTQNAGMDSATCRVLEKILINEEVHANELTTLLKEHSKQQFHILN